MPGRIKAIKESRSVSGFTGVALECIGDLYIEQGESEKLTVEANPELMPHVTSTVEDGVLRLYVTESPGLWKSLRGRAKLVFRLTVSELKTILLTGAGDIRAESLVVTALDVVIKGAGDVAIGFLKADDLSVQISGAGDCSIAGEVASQSLKISGAGDFDGGGLLSRDAAVSVSGAGEALISATDALAVSITGAGSVRYKGDPDVTSSVRGVGCLKRLG